MHNVSITSLAISIIFCCLSSFLVPVVPLLNRLHQPLIRVESFCQLLNILLLYEPDILQVRMILQAISPRFAINTLFIGGFLMHEPARFNNKK